MASTTAQPSDTTVMNGNAPSPSYSPEHELKREAAYPQYLPSTGIGSKMRGESSGVGVLVDGVEKTRENTPTTGMSVVSTPANEHPGVSSSSPAVPVAGNGSLAAAVDPSNNNGAVPNGNGNNVNNGMGRDDARAAVNRNYSGDKHDVDPSSTSTSVSQPQQHQASAPANPSYFPPFTTASSSSNTSNTSSSPPSSKLTFPNSLASSRDKSSLLGHPTPPHHGLPSPVQEEGEEDLYSPFPAPGSRTHNNASSSSNSAAAAANNADDDSKDKFDINAFNAIGSDLSNLQLDGLTIVSGDTEQEASPAVTGTAAEENNKQPIYKTPASERLTQHAKQLDAIGVTPSANASSTTTAVSSAASSPKPDNNRSRSSSTSVNAHAPTTPSSLSSSTHTSPSKPSSTQQQQNNSQHLQPPSAGTPTSSSPSHPVRPAPEQKKSMFGKLFQHKDKKDEKDKQQAGQAHQQHKDGYPSSNATSPSSSHGGGAGGDYVGSASGRNTSASRERERNASTSRGSTRERGYSSSGAVSGTESDHYSSQQAHSQPPPMVRRPSSNAVKDKEGGGGGGMGSFFSRRSSNKKMPQPDQSLLNMKQQQQQQQQLTGGLASSTASSRASPAASSTSVAATASTNTGGSSATETGNAASPSASTVTLASQSGKEGNTLGLPGSNVLPSSTAASRGSTPDISNMRTAAPSPSRQPTMDSASASGGGRPMMRRPSGSSQQSGLKGPNGVTGSGAHTPSGVSTDEKHQVSQKSLREHLAALGNSAGMGIGKLGRKPSQTSRKSDDGRSEKSAYHPDEHAPPVPAIPTAGEGSSSAPHIKRTPSVGGASVASSSLLKKYGYCEKVAIGKGATAVVKLAHKWDRSTEKLYAVKEFRKRRKNESEKEYVKKLTSEFCISSTLHHINIVETVDLVQNEEKHWCEVMEYCPGGDLYAAIKKGNMTAEDSNLYFKQIATGVAYLHSMGVAHRDIKPENLLLDAQGHIKITDFGVSDVFRMCWEKQTHLSKGLCGSEPYIAPEQFDHKEYDARLVDVWATAVVFYCMQAQELPWRVAKQSDPSFQSYLQYYPASSTPPPLGNLHPKECRAIVKKMLDPNPKTRIHMDAVLADPWVKAIAYDVPPEAAPSLRL